MRYDRLRLKNKFFVLTLVILLFFGIFYGFFTPNDVCYAVLPESYQAEVVDRNLEWQTAENFTDVAAAKKIVSSWKKSASEYDFDKLAADPIVVAVIDTGFKTEHEMFEGKYDVNGNPISGDGGSGSAPVIGEYDVLLRDSKGKIIGRNTYEKSEDLTDTSSIFHGTHVAGIVATLIHEFDLEKYIKIMPIKAFDDKGFPLSAYKSAIDFALNNGADVVNLSLGSNDATYYSRKEFDIDSSKTSKAVFVAAAGNSGKSCDTSYGIANGGEMFPGAGSGVVGVMNYYNNEKLTLSSTSNYGSKYDICAPGSGIYSANGDRYSGSSAYQALSGTSMASPAVAFAAALVTLRYRAYIPQNGEERFDIKPDKVREILTRAPSTSLVNLGVSYPTLNFEDLCSIVSVSGDKPFTFEQDRIEPITLTANIFPTEYEGRFTVSWYSVENGLKQAFLGTGNSINFTAPNTIGTHKVMAEIEDLDVSATIEITVTQKKIREDELEFNASGNYRENKPVARGDKLLFYIDNVENVNMNGVQLKWYVNNNIEAIGSRFEFSETKPDYYVITAVYNGKIVQTYRVVVDGKLAINILNFCTPTELFSYSAAMAIALISIITVVIIAMRKLKKL